MKFILTLIMSVFVITAFSQTVGNIVPYQWQSPGVQGHNLNDMIWISANRIIAVGDEGTIIISSDSGSTWTSTQLPTKTNFNAVCETNNQTLFVAGGESTFAGQIYRSTNGGVNWQLIYEDNASSISFNDICFVNDTIGYAACILGKVFKTIDGGNNWTAISIGNPINLKAMHFINADTGYVGGLTVGLYKTANGGLTWSQAFGYPDNNCSSMYFINDTLGYAGAYSGKIYKTINGGQNWTLNFNQANNEFIRKISFNSAGKGFAVSNGYYYKMSNGVNWSATFYGVMNKNCCVVTPGNALLMGGNYGGLLKANSYIGTFTLLNNSSLYDYYKIRFFDSQHGFVCGYGGAIAHTANGGLNWVKDSVSTFNSLNDIAAISSLKAVAVGENGEVHTTTNGGLTYTKQNLTTTSTLNVVKFVDNFIGYTAGNAGVIYKTTNGSQTWTAQNSGTVNDIVDMSFFNQSNGYCLTYGGDFLKTSNGGNLWASTYINVGYFPFRKIWFTSVDTGYVFDSQYNVIKTTNGGVTWSIVSNVCIENAKDVQFLNGQIGFVVGASVNASCDVGITVDGGLTWLTKNLPFAYDIFSIAAFDTANYYLCSYGKIIMKVGQPIITQVPVAESKISFDFSVFPNPANEELNIYLNNDVETSSSIQLFEITGRVCKQLSLINNESKYVISLDDIASGIYFIKVNGISKKIIVTH